MGERLYWADFVVLSHDTAADPVFTYANLSAQRLFKLSWEQFIGMPSRLSAEPMARAQRAALLQQVGTQGYIDGYQGIRIAGDGSRFRIHRATVWNLIDEAGGYRGQAACFSHWTPLSS